MVSQCANPDCRAPFVYLRKGRLAVVHHDRVPNRHFEYFWLCGKCAARLRFEAASDGSMHVVPVACATATGVPREEDDSRYAL